MQRTTKAFLLAFGVVAAALLFIGMSEVACRSAASNYHNFNVNWLPAAGNGGGQLSAMAGGRRLQQAGASENGAVPPALAPTTAGRSVAPSPSMEQAGAPLQARSPAAPIPEPLSRPATGGLAVAPAPELPAGRPAVAPRPSRAPTPERFTPSIAAPPQAERQSLPPIFNPDASGGGDPSNANFTIPVYEAPRSSNPIVATGQDIVGEWAHCSVITT